MRSSEIEPKRLEQLLRLEEKYKAMGQDIESYLDGLLYSDYLTYWEYIHLDTLLSLQTPRTHFEDEMIFITYHQITELYFKLILWELDQISEKYFNNASVALIKIKRINSYFDQLVNSFITMTEGMSKEEFLKFRMALLPASGFQSAQFRLIELCSTDLINLAEHKERPEGSDDFNTKDLFDRIYWKKGATELSSGKKTLTLEQFEKKYSSRFLRKIEARKFNNINQCLLENFLNSELSSEISLELKAFDRKINIEWKLAHMKSASRYLNRKTEVIKATGGSNWQEYLPPKFQRIIFFPSLYTDQEKKDWGKSFIQELL